MVVLLAENQRICSYYYSRRAQRYTFVLSARNLDIHLIRDNFTPTIIHKQDFKCNSRTSITVYHRSNSSPPKVYFSAQNFQICALAHLVNVCCATPSILAAPLPDTSPRFHCSYTGIKFSGISIGNLPICTPLAFAAIPSACR